MKEVFTRKRLNEAKYFYGKLIDAKTDDEFYFNLSAFMNAWRSILDVMLYDFNEHYSLGFNRDDYLNAREFRAVATALKNNQALKFIKWWTKRQKSLEKNPLWVKRNISVHRGYPPVSEYRIFVLGSEFSPYLKRINYPLTSPTSQTDPSSYYFSDVQEKTVIMF